MELKEQLLQALSDAVYETFSSILSLVPVVSEQKDPALLADTGDKLIASIGLAGALEGSLVMIAPAKSACQIVSKMLCMELPDITQDVLDGSGEMVNILAGGVKTRVATAGYEFEISIPTVIQGREPLGVATLHNAQAIHLYVSCQDITFSLILFFNIGRK